MWPKILLGHFCIMHALLLSMNWFQSNVGGMLLIVWNSLIFVYYVLFVYIMHAWCQCIHVRRCVYVFFWIAHLPTTVLNSTVNRYSTLPDQTVHFDNNYTPNHHPVPFLCPWPVAAPDCGGHQICCQANFTLANARRNCDGPIEDLCLVFLLGIFRRAPCPFTSQGAPCPLKKKKKVKKKIFIGNSWSQLHQEAT
jgi:hypothetical protein